MGVRIVVDSFSECPASKLGDLQLFQCDETAKTLSSSYVRTDDYTGCEKRL